MAQIELDTNEASVLRETLESVVSELGYEIANTDAKDFRDKLKEKQVVLRRLLQVLQPA